jgi:hypothetical protein
VARTQLTTTDVDIWQATVADVTKQSFDRDAEPVGGILWRLQARFNHRTFNPHFSWFFGLDGLQGAYGFAGLGESTGIGAALFLFCFTFLRNIFSATFRFVFLRNIFARERCFAGFVEHAVIAACEIFFRRLRLLAVMGISITAR